MFAAASQHQSGCSMGMGNPCRSWVWVCMGWVWVAMCQPTQTPGFLWVFPWVPMGWQCCAYVLVLRYHAIHSAVLLPDITCHHQHFRTEPWVAPVEHSQATVHQDKRHDELKARQQLDLWVAPTHNQCAYCKAKQHGAKTKPHTNCGQ